MTISFVSIPFVCFISKEIKNPLLIAQNYTNLVLPIFQAHRNANLRSFKNAALYTLNSIRLFQNNPKIDSLCKLSQFSLKREFVFIFTETLMLSSHFVRVRSVSLILKTASSSTKALYLFSDLPKKFSKTKTTTGKYHAWNIFAFVCSFSSALEETGKTYRTLKSLQSLLFQNSNS